MGGKPINDIFENVVGAIAPRAKSVTPIRSIYQGPLPIGDTELECAILDDQENTRIIGMTSVFKAFGRVARSNNRLINIPAFMDATNLQPFIDQELRGLITQIEYHDGKTKKVGYNALILPALCDMIFAVGFHRLDLLRLGKDAQGVRQYQLNRLSSIHLRHISNGVLASLGLPPLTEA